MIAELVGEAKTDAARRPVRADEINTGKLWLLAGVLGEGRHRQRLPWRHELRSVTLVEPFGLAAGVAIRRFAALDAFEEHAHGIGLLLGRSSGAVHPVARVRRPEMSKAGAGHDQVSGVFVVDRGEDPAGLKLGGGRRKMHSTIGGMKVHDTENADQYEAEHPAVRTHPDTGRKALYVSRSHTIRFKDMSEDESRPLIDFLQAHQTRPEFTCRVRWAPGTLTVWDNRCTQHNAINDYHGQRRRMRRLTVGAQTPR